MPYVAARVLNDGGRRIEAGDELSCDHWSTGALDTALKNNIVVFVPPQLLEVGPGPAPHQASAASAAIPAQAKKKR